jgi:cell division protein FtsB
VKQANRRGGDRSGRLGGYLPETITTRTLVLSVVVLLVFVLLVPTAREYAKQTAQLNSLQTELTQAQQQRADDTANLKRWDDPAFVKAQARARLGYVMPGEKAYRVTDPGAVAAGVSPATGQAVKPGVVQGTPGDDGAWYQKMWTSVQVAGAGAAGH